MPSVNVMKKRDKHENDLDTKAEKITALNQTIIRSTDDFQKALALYQDWKTQNKVEGIKY